MEEEIYGFCSSTPPGTHGYGAKAQQKSPMEPESVPASDNLDHIFNHFLLTKMAIYYTT
ncbi:hypothetical protein M5W75_20065 [Paenibacillus larvae]|uniref:hypothetical protein n=1 Tax=Paenibacillus larvae TaxID=1464 RepID=UPI00228017B1|nr:hypothetical protein [Paenibacillus larvae]MCY9752070.1 hypothetical protein [Paenibacillus larvae]